MVGKSRTPAGAFPSRTRESAMGPWVAGCRKDFPLLSRSVRGHPLVYLDTAATSQKPVPVIEAEDAYYRRLNANVHRGVYELSEEATDAYENARARVARFLHARSPEEVVFVRGTTEALNLVSTSLARGLLSRGDRVLLTEMEHHSNVVPWQLVARDFDLKLDYVGITAEGRLDPASLEEKLARGLKVFSFTHVSNVLGTVNPVAELSRRAHEVGALSVLDAAQSAPHLPLDVQKLGVDLLAFSGHKALGPMGIGVLWGRRELLGKLPPYQGGGEMIDEVNKERSTFRDPPLRFEAGTPNVAGAIGLSAALDYLEGLGWEALARHEQALLREAWEGLERIAGEEVRLFGPPVGPEHVGALSFALKGAHPHDIASLLDAEGVCVRAGHHCAQLVMRHYGVPALTRASYGPYNDTGDNQRFLSAMEKVYRLFSKG